MHVPKLSTFKVLILEPGNKFIIFQEHVSYDPRKYFSNRVISLQTLNSLLDSVVAPGSINSFKIKVTLISVSLMKK